MKKNILILFVILASFMAMTSCSFLDVVPDETATEEDAFSDARAAERFLYSCYGYLPDPRLGQASLDLFTGDEVISSFEHETFAHFPKGNFTANDPVISYWNTLFSGIKQCYLLKNNIGGVPNMEEKDKVDYTAQADFMIAYYHYLLLRCYGPIILVKEEPSIVTLPQDYLGRSTYDECVTWIAEKFDEASKNLPETRTGQRLGLATSTAAKAIKGRMLLFAASPLFNGNSKFYADFKNPDGTQLMPTTFDANKWVTAKQANKEAIDAAEKAGHRLYVSADAKDTSMPEPADPTQRALRFTFVDKTTKEVIWADTRKENYYAFQNKCRPLWAGASWNGICPTMAMLERFYTKNGLPISEDPEFRYDDRFSIVSFPKGDPNGEGETTRMNLEREPRYYAWISFHGGYYECRGEAPANNPGDKWPYLPQYKRGIDNNKLVTFFKRNDPCGKQNRTNNMAPGGFLNKKGVSPKSSSSASGGSFENYPWPVIRLAELYLNYAEACVETNDLDEAKKYINKVRERAGVPSLETAWGSIGVTLSQAKMREIVRQERMIELYLENHNFWDMRRWLLAEKYFDTTPQGLNADGVTMAQFSQLTDITSIVRNFRAPAHYLLPIPYGEVQRNKQLVQNPGY